MDVPSNKYRCMNGALIDRFNGTDDENEFDWDGGNDDNNVSNNNNYDSKGDDSSMIDLQCEDDFDSDTVIIGMTNESVQEDDGYDGDVNNNNNNSVDDDDVDGDDDDDVDDVENVVPSVASRPVLFNFDDDDDDDDDDDSILYHRPFQSSKIVVKEEKDIFEKIAKEISKPPPLVELKWTNKVSQKKKAPPKKKKKAGKKQKFIDVPNHYRKGRAVKAYTRRGKNNFEQEQHEEMELSPQEKEDRMLAKSLDIQEKLNLLRGDWGK